jgi:hypothetical protein
MKWNFREGDDYLVHQDSGGISLEILPQGGGFDHPFKVTYRKDGNDIKIKVRAGTVNNLVPTISSIYLDAEEAPELTITGTGHQDIVLEAELGDTPVFFPNNISINAFERGEYSDDNSFGYLAIASLNIVDGKVATFSQFVYSSQVVTRVKPGSATALWNWSSR